MAVIIYYDSRPHKKEKYFYIDAGVAGVAGDFLKHPLVGQSKF